MITFSTRSSSESPTQTVATRHKIDFLVCEIEFLQLWRRTIWVATMLLIVASVIGPFGRSCWVCELLTHFPAQFAIAELAVAAGFALAGSRGPALLLVALAAWTVAAIAPFYLDAPATPAVAASHGRVVRAIAVNISSDNVDRAAVIRVLRGAKPD